MKISVIIPFYNNAKVIKRTLQSVLMQTYKGFEVLLINDDSPDWGNALSIINSFNDERIRILSHQTNKNGATARNTGIKAANGDYLAFLDADDEWLPNHLENLFELLKSNVAEVVYTSCTVFSAQNFSYVSPKSGLENSKSLGEYLFIEEGFMQTSGLCVEKELAKSNLFNEALIRHQDYDFLLRLEYAKASFVWSKEPTVVVHWETNDIDRKGGSWSYSLNWYKDYKNYLSEKAKTHFIFKFVVLRHFKNRKVILGFKYFVSYCKPWHLSLKKYYFLISTVLFGKVIIPKL